MRIQAGWLAIIIVAVFARMLATPRKLEPEIHCYLARLSIQRKESLMK